ncbi:unknown [Sutterella sp. CAG:351]|nr:unknown [Sutterella sp. CAG:351]
MMNASAIFTPIPTAIPIQVARPTVPAFSMSRPAMISPITAPISGKKTMPQIPVTSPTTVPITAPQRPARLAPARFAPRICARISMPIPTAASSARITTAVTEISS